VTGVLELDLSSNKLGLWVDVRVYSV